MSINDIANGPNLKMTINEVSLSLLTTYELKDDVSLYAGITKYEVFINHRVDKHLIGKLVFYKLCNSLDPYKTLEKIGDYSSIKKAFNEDWSFNDELKENYEKITSHELYNCSLNIKILKSFFINNRFRGRYDLSYILDRAVEMLNFNGYLISDISFDKTFNQYNIGLTSEYYDDTFDFITIVNSMNNSVVLIKELDYEQ